MMKYRALLLCTFLLASLTILAQNRSRLDGLDGVLSGTAKDGGLGAATVSGTVRSFDGHAVQDARVEIRRFATAESVASGYTLPNGSFEFSHVPRGHYEIVVTAGLQEAREELQVADMDNNVDLHIGNASTEPANGRSTVSVAEMKIPDKARKAFQKAEELMRKHKPAEEVRQQLENALQIAPNYAAALTLRGILDLSEDKLEQARAECEQAIRSDASYGMGYVALGATYNSLARFDDALRALGRALSLLPNSWQGHFELAKSLLGKGKYQESLRQINQAGELVPAAYPPIHLVRAHALLGLNNYSQAITELEQYLGGAPNGIDAANARETLDQARAFAAAQGSK